MESRCPPPPPKKKKKERKRKKNDLSVKRYGTSG
jgi:hypothetical protein